MKIMKEFPLFDTMISSKDVGEKMEGYFGIKKKQREEITSALGVKIVVEKMLPPDSALFIDHKKRIVAVFRDGELVYSAQGGGRSGEGKEGDNIQKEEKKGG